MKNVQSLFGSLLLVVISTSVQAQGTVPKRQIPPAIVVQLRLLEHRFEEALLQDCAPEKCFPKGCTYGAHTVADQPESSSLPGLGLEIGPGSVPPQEYLTIARCSFAHERSIQTRDAQALVKRLQAKLSKGWMVVQISREILQPISDSLREAPEEKPVQEPLPEPNESGLDAPKAQNEENGKATSKWEPAVALRELWNELLPHFFWMIALFLLTISSLVIIWGTRRLGRTSPEEQALLTKMLESPADPTDNDTSEFELPPENQQDISAESTNHPSNTSNQYVQEQLQEWTDRLGGTPTSERDTVLDALIDELLRKRELGLLAKAVIQFPKAFPRAFPQGGELASVKLELAEYLKHVDPNELPSDVEFFTKLNRHLLSSSLSSQPDARIVRTLRDDFGSAGIADLTESLAGRHGALLFALTPMDNQYEVARLLSAEQRKIATQQLLLSNRMESSETAYLFDVLTAIKTGQAIPPAPPELPITDRGPEFDAATALCVLLPHLESEVRSSLFESAISRFNGTFPMWYSGIIFPDMLLKLSSENRSNIFLNVGLPSLAGWLSMQSADSQRRLLAEVPTSLQVAIGTSQEFSSRAHQLILAQKGREELRAALEMELSREKLSLKALLL